MAKKISYRAVPIERLTSALLAAMLVGARPSASSTHAQGVDLILSIA
jgi:hypothetical protein